MKHAKVGDTVKVVRHRNAYGAEMDSDYFGASFEIHEIIDDINADGEHGDWVALGSNDADEWFRSDDVEVVSRAVLSPIQTQTKRVLVPGVYGALKVQEYTNDLLRIDLESCVLDANELDQLSSVASQLADFLRGEKK